MPVVANGQLLHDQIKDIFMYLIKMIGSDKKNRISMDSKDMTTTEYFTHNNKGCVCSYKSQPYGIDIY